MELQLGGGTYFHFISFCFIILLNFPFSAPNVFPITIFLFKFELRLELPCLNKHNADYPLSSNNYLLFSKLSYKFQAKKHFWPFHKYAGPIFIITKGKEGGVGELS